MVTLYMSLSSTHKTPEIKRPLSTPKTLEQVLLPVTSLLQFQSGEQKEQDYWQQFPEILEIDAHLAELESLISQAVPHFNEIVKPEHVKVFGDFLVRRSEFIEGTDLEAPYSTQLRLTQICLALAHAISPILNVHPYKLLIRKLNIQKKHVSLGAVKDVLSDNDLQLHQFVLSDVDRDSQEVYPIGVLDCLSFAREDGILKHTVVLNEKTQSFSKTEHKLLEKKQQLSETEQQRIIEHSPEAKNLYQAIKKRVSEKDKSTSFGGHIQHLIKQLKKGSKGGSGTEEKRGPEVIKGINEFRKFMAALDDDERKQLHDLKASSITHSFKELWAELLSDSEIELTPSEADFVAETLCTGQIQYPCTTMISGNLETILHANHWLYEKHPKNIKAAQQVSILLLDDEIDEAEDKLIKALNHYNYQVKASYGDAGKKRLWPRLVECKEAEKFFAPKERKEKRQLPLDKFTEAFSYTDLLYSKEGKLKLCQLIRYGEMQLFPDPFKRPISGACNGFTFYYYQVLGQKETQRRITNDHHSQFCDALNKGMLYDLNRGDRLAFLFWLGADFVKQCIKTKSRLTPIDHLCFILGSLPADDRMAFLAWLGGVTYLKSIIKDVYNFVQIAKCYIANREGRIYDKFKSRIIIFLQWIGLECFRSWVGEQNLMSPLILTIVPLDQYGKFIGVDNCKEICKQIAEQESKFKQQDSLGRLNLEIFWPWMIAFLGGPESRLNDFVDILPTLDSSNQDYIRFIINSLDDLCFILDCFERSKDPNKDRHLNSLFIWLGDEHLRRIAIAEKVGVFKLLETFRSRVTDVNSKRALEIVIWRLDGRLSQIHNSEDLISQIQRYEFKLNFDLLKLIRPSELIILNGLSKRKMKPCVVVAKCLPSMSPIHQREYIESLSNQDSLMLMLAPEDKDIAPSINLLDTYQTTQFYPLLLLMATRAYLAEREAKPEAAPTLFGWIQDTASTMGVKGYPRSEKIVAAKLLEKILMNEDVDVKEIETHRKVLEDSVLGVIFKRYESWKKKSFIIKVPSQIFLIYSPPSRSAPVSPPSQPVSDHRLSLQPPIPCHPPR